MIDFPSYISWFTDGEWCFSVSFTIRKSLSLWVEVRPSFSISQKNFSLWVLQQIQSYFNCWWIRKSEKDGTYKFEIRSINDIVSKVLPHFINYPLITDKRNDFINFQRICDLVHSNQHLNQHWLSSIIDLAYSMNRSWKRKYPKKDLLKIIDKMKV